MEVLQDREANALVATSPPARQAPDSSPALIYLARLSTEKSRRTQRGALDGIAHLVSPGSECVRFPWHRLDYRHTVAIRSKLAERYAPATVNRYLAALRGCLRECWRLGLISAEHRERACDLVPVKGDSLMSGRALSRSELAALFAACASDDSVAGSRDAGLLAAGYFGGLRRAEIVALDLTDYDGARGELTVRRGKGGKARRVPVAESATLRLDAYVEIRGTLPGALFYRTQAPGRLVPERLSDQTVRDVLARRAEQAGIAACTPHDLRRSMISSMLDAGVDLSTVQQIAGHANVTTTQRYDRRGDDVKRRAAQTLSI